MDFWVILGVEIANEDSLLDEDVRRLGGASSRRLAVRRRIKTSERGRPLTFEWKYPIVSKGEPVSEYFRGDSYTLRLTNKCACE